MEARTATRRGSAIPAWVLGLLPLVLIATAIASFVALGGPGLADRKGPHRSAPAGVRPALRSPASKKPIQPSSVNSDWWAWNMNLPGLWNSISMMQRSPWHNITVSVYSNWSVDPVR